MEVLVAAGGRGALVLSFGEPRFSLSNREVLDVFGGDVAARRDAAEMTVTLANGSALGEKGVTEYVERDDGVPIVSPAVRIILRSDVVEGARTLWQSGVAIKCDLSDSKTLRTRGMGGRLRKDTDRITSTVSQGPGHQTPLALLAPCRN